MRRFSSPCITGLTVTLLLALLPACGKRGPLVYPEALAPAAATTLKAEQKGERLYLSWYAPSKDRGGKPLKGLGGYRIERRLQPDCASCPDGWQPLVVSDLAYPRGVEQHSGLYLYHDASALPDTPYQYRLVAYSADGYDGVPTAPVSIRLLPPPPVPQLTASADARFVRLAWQVPAASGELAYRVYRREAGANAPLVLLTPQPVAASSYEDREALPQLSYRYTVRAVKRQAGQEVEGDVSNEVTISLALGD